MALTNAILWVAWEHQQTANSRHWPYYIAHHVDVNTPLELNFLRPDGALTRLPILCIRQYVWLYYTHYIHMSLARRVRSHTSRMAARACVMFLIAKRPHTHAYSISMYATVSLTPLTRNVMYVHVCHLYIYRYSVMHTSRSIYRIHNIHLTNGEGSSSRPAEAITCHAIAVFFNSTEDTEEGGRAFPIVMCVFRWLCYCYLESRILMYHHMLYLYKVVVLVAFVAIVVALNLCCGHLNFCFAGSKNCKHSTAVVIPKVFDWFGCWISIKKKTQIF